MTRVTKGKIVELATMQAGRAKNVTAGLRSHGWRFHYEAGERVASDDAWRARQAQFVLGQARLVARDAQATLSWVEAWAKQEGAE